MLVLCVSALLVFTWMTPALRAQTNHAPASHSHPSTHRARTRATPDDRVKVLAKSLDLSESQLLAVKKILEQRQQETLRLRTDSSMTGSERIDRFRALQDETVVRIRAVLNEEQKKKYDPLAARRVVPDPQQRSVEDWLNATTPQ